MILIYLWFLLCLCSAFGGRIVRENPQYSANDEQFNNIAWNVNSSVDACDNFYEYACGNYFLDYNEKIHLKDNRYNEELLNLMDNLYQRDYQVTDTHQTFVEKTRIYLKSCHATTIRDYKKYLEEIKPADHLDWPIWQPQQWQVNAEADKLFDVWSLVGRIHSYGINDVLISIQIFVHENGTFNIMLEPPAPEDGTILPDIMLMRLLLRNVGIRNTEKILEDLLELNKDLLKIQTVSYDSITLSYDQLDSAYPQLNLKQYFRELFRKELPANTFILIRKPKYFQQLNDNMWQTFRRRTMCNYLMLKFLVYLTKDSVNELTDLGCIKDLRNKMDVSIKYLYKKHVLFKNVGDIKKDIEQLQRDILQQYDKIFNENHLQLKPEQLQLLKQKLHNVTLNINNLNWNSTYNEIEHYYDTLPLLDGNNYFKNHLLLLRHRFEKSLLYTDNQAFNNDGSNSGARYVTKENMIILPFGSLKKPLYSFNYHPLYKFSLLGFSLAQEYAHAFDTDGLNFNGDGKPSDDIAALLEERNFQNSLQCLQTQLSTQNIAERLADIVASRVAYNLFKFQPKTNKFICPSEYNCDTSQRYFHEQIFYLSLAQNFCDKSWDLHQIAINSEGFAEAFHCRLGSKMNPHTKCRVY